jgi:hypothetical protein
LLAAVDAAPDRFAKRRSDNGQSQLQQSKEARSRDREKRARKKADARTARGPTDGPAAPVSLARAPATNPAAATNPKSLAAAAFIRWMNKTP